MPKRAHTLPPTTPLLQQVGGHVGVQITEDKSLLLKPALPCEIAFYQLARDIDDPSTGVYALRDWMPRFLGLLSLEGKIADTDAGMTASTSGGDADGDDSTPPSLPPQTLVLQNLLYGYCKPCVLDVKLGTVLYDENASEEKKARMIQKAAQSTSLQTGIRLTGFQVYSNHSPDPVVYGRAYGYSIKSEQLLEGLGKFFPCSMFKSIGADHPEMSVPSGSDIGLPADTLLTLLTSLRASLAALRKCLEDAHVRMVGSSVLIIYEGDWERAAAASGRGGGPSDDQVDSEDSDTDQIEVEIDEQGEIIFDSIPDIVSSDTSSDTDLQPRLYTVSLIDFAHTRVVPGQGPDEGVLKGMNSLIGLVECRIQEVEAFIGSEKEY